MPKKMTANFIENGILSPKNSKDENLKKAKII